jgi:hypothetical protein
VPVCLYQFTAVSLCLKHAYGSTKQKATLPTWRFGTEKRDVKCRFYGNEGLSAGNRCVCERAETLISRCTV